ncbi:uncharacterized protein LOC123398056 isoform X2 [Hordeum vulgare subsp. vulgare]|uniref:uncharacterized protein LOC123398056 isoform X2 n=1 Tax=Hordeum vulgare subsp. vulgare TaxID=112509 RepID=UPI001D1A3ED3|nr:uncharacterized protein LOC123398056 isoform X2 [Hordeum vulgare subsp. vulgare]
MASKVLPRECLPRRSPTGRLEPITAYFRVDEEGNYRPSRLPPAALMASKVLPRECLPRRSPTGRLEPITVYVRVDEEGNYRPRYISAKVGRVFRDLQDLKEAARRFYTNIYFGLRLLKRPLAPPPSLTDDIFQFEFVVDGPTPVAHVSSLKASTALGEKSSGTEAISSSSHKVPDEKPAEVSSLKPTTLEEESSGNGAISSSSFGQPDQDTAMASPPSGNCLASPSGPGIWERERRDWGFFYYIRVDLKGYFHTYPYAGGPFQSLEQVDKAMDCYFHQHLDPNLLMNKGGVPSREISIEKTIYWPDGRRKKHSKSYMIQQYHNRMRRLLLALVEKHNEDHSLSADLAYELKDVLHCATLWEGLTSCYYHLNFTVTKGADDSNAGIENLFFAEVQCVLQGEEEEMLVSCFRAVESTDNGYCYGCTMDRDVNMKHPNSAGAYLAGELKVGSHIGYYCHEGWSNDSDDENDVADKACTPPTMRTSVADNMTFDDADQ